MADIILSRRARDDFKRIWRFVALDDMAAGDRLLLAMDAKIERLRAFPEIGTPRDEIAPGARSLTHGAYLILYDYNPATDSVEIVAIVEAMRDLSRLF